MDAYQILGVTPTTPFDDIVKSYKSLCKIHHPDIIGGNAEKFKDINNAMDYVRKNYGKVVESKKVSSKGFVKYKNIIFSVVDVFNGIDFKASYFNNLFNVDISFRPRDVTGIWGIKTFSKRSVKDRNAFLIYELYMIGISTNTVNITFENYDIIVKVTLKTNESVILTPLKGIIIKNSKPYNYVIENLGLYQHTPEGTVNGKIIIDNSINEPLGMYETLQNPMVMLKINLVIGIILGIAHWLYEAYNALIGN